MIIFLSNNLQGQALKLPLTFLTPAIIKGRLYKFNKDTILISPECYHKAIDNSVVYGSLYSVPDDNYFLDVLDKLHTCVRNHDYSLHHRVTRCVYPISFKNIDELDSLRYTESSPIQVVTYIGNIKNNRVKGVMQEIKYYNRLRIVNGINKAFLKQINLYLNRR